MRKEIDKVDEKIVSLLNKRQKIASKIIAEKKSKGLPIKDPIREKEIITRLRKIYDNKLVERVYEEIFKSNYSWNI